MKTLSQATRNHPFTRDFKPQHAERLLAHASVVEFDAGEIVFREGEPANRLYLIEAGEVQLESRSARFETVQFETLGDGDTLGWSWLFPGFAWHFQVRATRATRVICCDAARLLVQAEEDHDFGYELMKRVSQIIIHRLQVSRKRLSESRARLNDTCPLQQ